MPRRSSLFSVESPVPLRDTAEHEKRHPSHHQQLAPIFGVMEGTSSPTARSSLASPDPPRSLPVTPLIADKMGYGEAPGRVR
jgi:hypothetical protein